MPCTRCGTLKKTNLETYTCTDCHLKIDRDVYIKYMHPYSIPPQGSESVSNHCTGDLALLVSLWIFSIFSEIRAFNEETVQSVTYGTSNIETGLTFCNNFEHYFSFITLWI
eukprot:NODE_150_length_17275_cov_0.559618.p15 type:complete len:111 gc:universal NODE_150_length_17275_cov_0.559618:16055-15723(-)